jgi:HK97 family phage major capsid protein
MSNATTIAKLKDDLAKKQKAAQELYGDLQRLKQKAGGNNADLSKDEIFNPIYEKSKEYYKAAAEAEIVHNELLGVYDAEAEGKTYTKAHKGDPAWAGDNDDRWLAEGYKALVEGGGSGAFIAPPEFSGRAWDRLAPKSAMLRSGPTVITTDRKELHLPRVTADIPADWVAEAGTITAGDPTISEVVFVPRKLAALTQSSHELLVDSSPEAASLIQGNMLRALALKFDLGAFEGTGTVPQIRGLKNQAGIQSVSMGANGATPTNLDPFADALGLLATANAEGPYAIVMHPRTWQTLTKLKEQTSGNNKPLLQGPEAPTKAPDRSIYGYPVFLTSQLSITETQGTSTDASSAYVYQPDQGCRRQAGGVPLRGRQLPLVQQRSVGTAGDHPGGYRPAQPGRSRQDPRHPGGLGPWLPRRRSRRSKSGPACSTTRARAIRRARSSR